MNKRILSVFICVLLIAAVICAVPAGAKPAERMNLSVVADTTEANPGDTITFQVIMGPVSEIGSIQMVVDLPEGLTYVAGSGEAVDKSVLGFDGFAWSEQKMMLNGFSIADYASTADTYLGSFKCTVDENADGTLSVGLTSIEMGSCETFEDFSDMFDVIPASVAVAGDTPVEPTTAPVEPTVAPVDPTETPEPETVAPTAEPTKAPATVAPTTAPTQGGKSTPDSGKSTATKDSTSPKTSDSGMIFVWIGLFALAILGVAGTFVFKKARK